MANSTLASCVRVTALLGGAALALAAGTAQAQSGAAQTTAENDSDDDEAQVGPREIIVTAERRATNLQDTPLSVVAITGETAEAKGIDDLEDLARFTPNLAITPTRGGGNNTANFVIRGIGGGGGATGERGVGLYIDGIYMPRTSGAVLRVLDLDRVEVLRGPQGTLFGRNSTGGAIRLFSKQPTQDFEGYIRGTVGEMGRHDIAGTVNLPVTDSLAVRGQLAFLEQDGYVERGTELLGADQDFIARFQAKFQPHDRFRATLGFLYNKSEANGTPYVMSEFDMRPGIEGVIQGNYADWINDFFKLAGQAPLAAYNDSRIVTGDPYRASSLCFIDDVNPDYDPACNQYSDDKFWQLDLNVVMELSDTVTLTSITGYSELVHRGLTDFQVLGTESRTENVDSSVFYQEAQLNVSVFDGEIDLVTGGNYFREDSSAPNFNITRRGTSVFPSNPGTPPNADAGLFRTADSITSQTSRSFGLFASATMHLTEQLNLTAGARYAIDEKDYAQTRFPGGNPGTPDFVVAPGTTSTTVHADDTFHALDWRATLDYHVTPDIMAYATASKAYKAGTFSYSIVGYTAANNATGERQSAGIKPIPNEKVVNFEAGLRMTLFDRLRLNPTVFLMDFTNRQAGVQVTCGTGVLASIPANGPQCPVGFLIQVQNQGDVRLKGFEVDGQLTVMPGLWIDGGLAVTDSRLINPPAGTVNLFPDLPSPTWNLGLTYAPQLSFGDVTFNVSYARVGEQDTHPTEGTDSAFRLPAYGVMNARVRLEMNEFPASITLYANNLLDTVYATYGQRFGGGFWDSGAGTGLAAPLRSALSLVRGRPRELGVTLQYDF